MKIETLIKKLEKYPKGHSVSCCSCAEELIVFDRHNNEVGRIKLV